MMIFYIFVLILTQVECEEFERKNDCLNHVSSILGDTYNPDLCDYRNLKWTTDVDQKNEEGNYYKHECECLNAMLPSMIDGKTQLYCEACDTACQFCPRKGHWIKFNVSLNTNCYCDMTTCVDGVSTIGGIDTVRCSGNAIMDGRGKCIDLVEINPNLDEDLEDLFKSSNEKSPENGTSDPNGIYTVQCSNGQVMDESSKIILLFLLALCF